MLAKLFIVALSAIFIENVVFVKLLGVFPIFDEHKRIKTLFNMGAYVALVMVLSSSFMFLVNKFLIMRFNLTYLRIIIFVLIIVITMKLLDILLMTLLTKIHNALKNYFPYVITNCAVLGIAIIIIDRGLSFFETIAYSFFSAVGFTLALILILSIKEKLQFCSVPKAFEGAPILFIAIALLAMAFMGFSGIKFPV